MDYDKTYFLAYIYRVVNEMKIRNIKYKNELFSELYDFCSNKKITYFILDKTNYSEHDDRYLKQCLYNLQEKFDRKIITKDEWGKIEDLKEMINK